MHALGKYKQHTKYMLGTCWEHYTFMLSVLWRTQGMAQVLPIYLKTNTIRMSLLHARYVIDMR